MDGRDLSCFTSLSSAQNYQRALISSQVSPNNPPPIIFTEILKLGALSLGGRARRFGAGAGAIAIRRRWVSPYSVGVLGYVDPPDFSFIEEPTLLKKQQLIYHRC